MKALKLIPDFFRDLYDELGRSPMARDLAEPAPILTAETKLALALVEYATAKNLSAPALNQVLALLNADNAETARVLRMSCLRS
ncbi:MAG: hypothetical protein B7Y12_01965 [Rhizobiales bacterium 24-66-13]|jgi:hypothetical protein|nr:MAG: hypothetical protein B7Y61_01000 [Rhizobiales bacterium 35-66-30]OYZ82782.1 MAG: hypothetical protein B7Y12_01965 [Rhizobiales bacterium 24-66-13]OZB11815.1 MAG: hypothetical protein B7X67_01945 [Rhizobiales bacterium 39-66-18]HQS09515.1 hypothetical protein [Xanthobacteraceae bacterium]HQS46812.1 hypothetical protein [Xanthobacteraceae bacterium]